MSKPSFSDIINSATPVVVDFYADWCGPSQIFAPILEKLKLELGNQASVIQIDVDKDPHLVSELNIHSLPTVMIFQNGEIKRRGMGIPSLKSLKKKVLKLVA